MSDDILYERHGHVRLITINRPTRMNSMDFAANDALIERWKEFDADDDARVAVVTGAGERAFCAGADLKTYTMAYATTPVPEFRRRFTNGPGFGGNLGLLGGDHVHYDAALEHLGVSSLHGKSASQNVCYRHIRHPPAGRVGSPPPASL